MERDCIIFLINNKQRIIDFEYKESPINNNNEMLLKNITVKR